MSWCLYYHLAPDLAHLYDKSTIVGYPLVDCRASFVANGSGVIYGKIKKIYLIQILRWFFRFLKDLETVAIHLK